MHGVILLKAQQGVPFFYLLICFIACCSVLSQCTHSFSCAFCNCRLLILVPALCAESINSHRGVDSRRDTAGCKAVSILVTVDVSLACFKNGNRRYLSVLTDTRLG